MKIYRISQASVTLMDLMDDMPEGELLGTLIDEYALNIDYPLVVSTMSPQELSQLKVHGGDITVLESYQQFADSDQRSIVEGYMTDPNLSNEIIVIDNFNSKLVDGHHRVVAAIQTNESLQYVDISDISDIPS